MNRRYFIKTISTILGMATVPNVILNAFDTKEISMTDARWIAKNYEWIWDNLVDNYTLYKGRVEEKDGFQIFKNVFEYGERDLLLEVERRRVHKIREHKVNIVYEVVFGKYRVLSQGITTMSGFLEKHNRKPTREDKLIVEVVQGRFLKYHKGIKTTSFNCVVDMIVSELRLV